MAKRKKGIIITSTCALLAGAAVIAELALGGGTGGNGVGRQQGWQNLQKEIFYSAYNESRKIPTFPTLCTSQQKVDTFFIFYTLKTEHSTPYIVLVSNSLMSMQVFLH